ncbi:MAG: molybdopterin-guanine dinucleotide biosynthesis protein B [Lentisphaeria bacterium]|nr:molybdopterin-guanine dinucleotide biosynthesis protein B [Lentisphaeria bacterium]
MAKVTSNAKTDSHHGRRQGGQPYAFNPYEIAVCGYSNSGKTVLARRLIESLSGQHRVGYVKQAHDFEMDRPGKDSFEAAAAGATDVFVATPEKTASLTQRGTDKFHQQRQLIDADCVVVEGLKHSELPKMVVVDAENRIRRDDLELQNVLAWIEPGQRDDIAAVRRLVDGHFAAVTESRPLYGLVLAGGRSTRMQQDKAALDYHGKPQVRHAGELLGSHCAKTFVSVRGEQSADAAVHDLPQICDRHLGFGPMGGILSAMHEHPEAAWLVLACDLPFVDDSLLTHLLANRQPMQPATAYRSTSDSFPEPLCAIWEPKSIFALLHFMGLGYKCPRKVLINTEIRLLEQPFKHALDNANRPEEYAEIKKRISQETDQ